MKNSKFDTLYCHKVFLSIGYQSCARAIKPLGNLRNKRLKSESLNIKEGGLLHLQITN